MRLQVHGAAVAGGTVRVTVERDSRDDEEVEVRLEAFERAGVEERAEVHDRRTARPGETIELDVPADAWPGWTKGDLAIGWRVASGGGWVSRPDVAPVEIDPTSVRPMTDERARALRVAAAESAREVSSGELITIVGFVLLGVAVMLFGVVIWVSPPQEDQPAAVGPVTIGVGLVLALPSVLRYLRKVRPLAVESCVIDPDPWTDRGRRIRIRVETASEIDLVLLCRIERFVRGFGGTRGHAHFREIVLGERRRRVEPGHHELTFSLESRLPPTHPGEVLRIRHVVHGAPPDSGRNTHRRNEVQFVVA